MKQLLFITALLISGLSIAQGNNDKIDAYRVAFLTQELQLSSDEAQKFWPIYNDIKDDRDKLYEEKKKLMDSSTL